MNGKGSSPRKKSVDQKTWDDNWNNIFRNKFGVKVKILKDENKYGTIVRRLDSSAYEIEIDNEILVLNPNEFKEI